MTGVDQRSHLARFLFESKLSFDHTHYPHSSLDNVVVIIMSLHHYPCPINSDHRHTPELTVLYHVLWIKSLGKSAWISTLSGTVWFDRWAKEKFQPKLTIGCWPLSTQKMLASKETGKVTLHDDCFNFKSVKITSSFPTVVEKRFLPREEAIKVKLLTWNCTYIFCHISRYCKYYSLQVMCFQYYVTQPLWGLW